MADQGKHIDDLFREGLGDYREAPASDIWSKLEQRLPEPEAPAPPPVATQSSGNNRWLWYVLLLALLGTVGYFVVRKSLDSSSAADTNQNIENHGTTPAAGGPSVTPADINDDNASNPATGAGTNGPSTDNSNGPTGINADDNIAGAPSTTSTHKSTAASGSDNSAGNNPATPSGNNTAKSTAGSKKPDNNNTVQNSAQDADNSTASPSGSASSTKSGKNTNGKTATNNNGSSAGSKTSNASAGNTVADNATPKPGTASGKPTNAKPANETSKPVKPLAAATNPPKSKPADKPAKENNNKLDTEQAAKFNDLATKPAQPATYNDPKVKPESASNDKTAPIGDMTYNMGSKNRVQKPAVPAAEIQAKKTFEVTKDGVKMLDVPEDDPKAAIVADEDDEAEVKEEPVVAKAAEVEEEQPQPAVQMGSGVVGGGGGASAASEPRVPLRNFSGGGVLSGGVKAGFEKGFSVNATAAVFSPYLEWAITPKVSLVLQPSFRYNSLSLNMFNDPMSYHNITSATRDTDFTYIPDTQQTLVQRTYIFSNTYDSIVLVRSIDKKSYWEVDLPLMAKFNVGGGLSLTGGIVLSIGNIPRISYEQLKFGGLQKTAVDSFAAVPTTTPEPNLPPASQYFTYNTPDISTAPTLTAQNPSGNPARFGYMVGFNYELNNKFMIDVLVRGSLSDMRYIPDEQIRKVYTQPNLRIMFGVKLFESGRSPKKTPSGL